MRDVYQRVTDRILADLEQGVWPWLRPWNADHAVGRITRPLRHNGMPYRGINILMLWDEALHRGFSAPTWMTFRQARELGGHVRKGETGSLVVYADTVIKSDSDHDDGEGPARSVPFMRAYSVFNVEQIVGLPGQYHTSPLPRLEPMQRIGHAEVFCAATGAQIGHGGNRACYNASEDRIQMPPFQAFRDAESYHATVLHELVHWTKHDSRLDRDLGRKRFGDAGYALEELVAELGAAFLCADLEISAEARPDHAAYIDHWLTILRGDNRAIFTAAGHAQRAADHLHGLQAEGTANLGCQDDPGRI